MSATVLIEFDDPSEHTFDNTKLTLLNDKGQLLSQVSPNEILFGNYDGLGDGSGGSPVALSRRGGKTLVFSGIANTGQVANGVLEFPNTDKSLATYQNITDIVDDFALRCRVEMNVATVSSDRNLINLNSNVDQSNIRFFVGDLGGGISRVRLTITDSGGVVTTNKLILAEPNFTTDPNFNVAISNDDDGNMLVHFNGSLHSTIASPSFDFTDCDVVFGDNVSSFGGVANFDNFQLFKANEIVAAFAFPFPEPTTFDLNEHLLVTAIPQIVDEIIEVDITHEISPNTQLKFIVILNSVSFWFNGTVWEISDRTLSQANTEAEIKANLSSIPITKGIGKLMEFGSIFKSDSGYATPLVENATFKYGMSFKASDVVLCNITGTIKDNSGSAVEGATIRVQSEDKFFNNVIIGPSAKTLSNNQGKFSISVPESATANLPVDFFIEYTEKTLTDGKEVDSNVIFEVLGKIVPNAATAELSSLQDAT